MKIEMAQVAGIEGDLDANLDKALQCIERARDDTDLIVFPETHLTGFAEEGAAGRAIAPDDPLFTTLHQAATRKNLAVAIGFLERIDEKRCCNASVLITPRGWISSSGQSARRCSFWSVSARRCVSWKTAGPAMQPH